MTDPKSRTWCMTLNNYTEDELDFAKNKWAAICTRWIAACEVGEEGTPHIQAYMTLRRPQRLAWLKKRWPRSNFRTALASEEENWVYCLKPGEDGKVNVVADFKSNTQGARNDLTDFYEVMKVKGIKRAALEDPAPYIKYHKGMEKINKIYIDSQNDFKAKFTNFNIPKFPLAKGSFTIFWGESGIGKTQFALSHFNNPLLVAHIESLRDFDPYEHDGIVMDDMEFEHLPRVSKIHICDSTYQRAIHMRHYNWDKPAGITIIVTTNNYKGRIFGSDSDDKAITRRVDIHGLGENNLFVE